MKILHVGCGGEPLPSWLAGHDEVRVDVDPLQRPDVVADMRALPEHLQGFDMVLCHHAIEHLHPEDIVPALAGFKRVLRQGGAAVVIVPDCEGVADDDQVLYESPAGKITGRDLWHGLQSAVDENPYMRHFEQFTADKLRACYEAAGFATVQTKRLGYCYNLFGVGVA